MVLPLAAAFFVAVLFFFRVLQVQTDVAGALSYAARKTACEAGAVSQETVLLVSAEVLFRKELHNCRYVDSYVPGGISLLRSNLSGDYVELRADYFVRLPIRFFTVEGFAVSQCSVSRKWTGDGDTCADEMEDYVYVTKNGTVYHRSRGCSYLDLSIQAVESGTVDSRRNKGGGKYYACSCVSGKDTGVLYITDYGTSYHQNLACSGLKRTVYMVPLSKVGGKGACSKCGNP